VFEGDGCGSWETTRGSKGTVSEKIMEISHLGGDILVSTWSARRAATGPEFQERPKKRVATGREYHVRIVVPSSMGLLARDVP
jgi:hypothetical protein